jgi:hypothetical protein
MIQRVTWVGVASLAVLAVALSCPGPIGIALAQTPDTASVTVAPAPAPAHAGMVPGRGGVGGQLGGSYFTFDGDYSSGVQPRFAFAGNLRYVVSEWLRLQFSPGFTWTAYSNTEPVPFQDLNFPTDTTKDGYLTLLVPISLQGQWLVHRGAWHYHLGAGPGLYRVWVENHRKVLKDRTSKRLHRGLYPGASAELGVERFMKVLPSTSVEVAVVSHLVFAQRDEQFINGFNSNVGAVEARVGANYYFDLQRQLKRETDLPLGSP